MKRALFTQHSDLPFLVELPGIEPDALPGLLPSELPFRSVSFRFSPARYLRFRSRVLTASRAVTYRRKLPASYVPGAGSSESGRGHRSVADLGWPRPSLRPEGRRGPPRRVTTPVCSSSTSCDVNTCPHERCRGVPPRFIGLLGDAATVRGK